jgi:hypothetical protein
MKYDSQATVRLFEIFEQNQISDQDKLEVRNLLKDFPISILGCDKEGNSLLHLAVQHNDEEIDAILRNNPHCRSLESFVNDDQKTAFQLLLERNQKLTSDNITIISRTDSDNSLDSTSSEASTAKSPTLPEIQQTKSTSTKTILSPIKEEPQLPNIEKSTKTPATATMLFKKNHDKEFKGESVHPSKLKSAVKNLNLLNKETQFPNIR